MRTHRHTDPHKHTHGTHTHAHTHTHTWTHTAARAQERRGWSNRTTALLRRVHRRRAAHASELCSHCAEPRHIKGSNMARVLAKPPERQQKSRGGTKCACPMQNVHCSCPQGLVDSQTGAGPCPQAVVHMGQPVAACTTTIAWSALLLALRQSHTWGSCRSISYLEHGNGLHASGNARRIAPVLAAVLKNQAKPAHPGAASPAASPGAASPAARGTQGR